MEWIKNKYIRPIVVIICCLIIICANFSVFAVLGLFLMGYDDHYNTSKGEYFSLASMNTTEKMLYICYNTWIILNIIGLICILIYIGRKMYKRISNKK